MSLNSVGISNIPESPLFDEPSLHLHPIKQIDFWKFITKKNTNQIVSITHSPYMVNLNLLKPDNRLLYLKMLDGRNIIFSSANIQPHLIKLKDHSFKPEIFFSKCNVFVEGTSDESAISAISDKLGGIFNRYSIQTVNAGGKDILESYVDIIEAFSIPHVVMTDYDYLCDSNTKKTRNRKATSDFVVLPQRLEEVLHIFDTSVKVMENFDFKNPCNTNKDDQPKSVETTTSYKIVSEAMSKNVDSVKSSKLGEIVTKALEKCGVTNLDWKSYLTP